MGNTNQFGEYEYEPTEIDEEIFLSEIPLSLMMETIRTQFDDPLEYRKNDYIQTFFNKYHYTMENITQDDEEEVEELYTKFISYIENLFKEYLGIGIPNLEDMSDDEQEEIIHCIYRYFIMNIRKNFIHLIFNFINKRKSSLCEKIEKKKDVTSLSLKKNVTDEDDVTILSNLSEVISIILEYDFTIDDFFEYARTESTGMETDFISDCYDGCEITGNFVQQYIQMVDEDLRIEIECKVRNKILKKYSK